MLQTANTGLNPPWFTESTIRPITRMYGASFTNILLDDGATLNVGSYNLGWPAFLTTLFAQSGTALSLGAGMRYLPVDQPNISRTYSHPWTGSRTHQPGSAQNGRPHRGQPATSLRRTRAPRHGERRAVSGNHPGVHDVIRLRVQPRGYG